MLNVSETERLSKFTHHGLDLSFFGWGGGWGKWLGEGSGGRGGGGAKVIHDWGLVPSTEHSIIRTPLQKHSVWTGQIV